MKTLLLAAVRGIVLLSAFVCAGPTQADTADDITITAINSVYENGGVRYYFKVNWLASSTRTGFCTKRLANLTICNVSLGVFGNPGAPSPMVTANEWDLPAVAPPGMTLNGMLSKMMSQGYVSSVFVSNTTVGAARCIGFSYAVIGPNIGGAIQRVGPCEPVRPAMLQCDISGDTTIDHKSLADNALEGTRASTKLGVKCQGVTSFHVSTSRTDSFGVQLRDDGSLYSQITVDGRDAFYGIDVRVTLNQTRTLEIVSTLKTRGEVAAGPFSGSTIIRISPP